MESESDDERAGPPTPRNPMKTTQGKLSTEKKPSFSERSLDAFSRAYDKHSSPSESGRSAGRPLPDPDLSEGSPYRGKTGRGLGESPPEVDMESMLENNLGPGQDPSGPRPNESEQEPGPGADLSATAEPGMYKADGDPYTYEVGDDGSVWIADGPSGRGMQVKAGTAAHTAIMGQIDSGVLTAVGPWVPTTTQKTAEPPSDV